MTRGILLATAGIAIGAALGSALRAQMVTNDPMPGYQMRPDGTWGLSKNLTCIYGGPGCPAPSTMQAVSCNRLSPEALAQIREAVRP